MRLGEAAIDIAQRTQSYLSRIENKVLKAISRATKAESIASDASNQVSQFKDRLTQVDNKANDAFNKASSHHASIQSLKKDVGDLSRQVNTKVDKNTFDREIDNNRAINENQTQTIIDKIDNLNFPSVGQIAGGVAGLDILRQILARSSRAANGGGSPCLAPTIA
ncbi:hypothetical protein NIES4102_34000 [Chondrocystis sp. NIES-4102]|nr:hypothetical protein NIES4102_34000 [Chondrocystis sp. NIES-4102]